MPEKSNKLARQRKVIHRLRLNWQEEVSFAKDRMKAQVILYSKPGCHLCEQMKAEMASAECAQMYELEEINIETDRSLFTRYGNDIPVLLINGVEAFRHRLDSESFRKRLTREFGESSC